MCFTKQRRKNTPSFRIYGSELEHEDRYSYLGLEMSCTGSRKGTQAILSNTGL